jgi:PAS domain S-box-containing protein
MSAPVNILLVDDQPGKLLAYEVILKGLNENLVKAASGREALEFLLKNDVAVVLIDVCMPEFDGFQLAAMLREHPRFKDTAIIFISAVHLTDMDRIRGYAMGAVDYVPVPVIPEVLQAKVKIFVELYRKTHELETLNIELERHVAERTAELEASNKQLLQSEQGRSLALVAGQMGSWEWDVVTGRGSWDEGQYRIFGVTPDNFQVSLQGIRDLIHPEDLAALAQAIERMAHGEPTQQIDFRVRRPDGGIRWCIGTAAASVDAAGTVSRISGVTIDVTDRKEAEDRQVLLAREVDHRARNALAIIQAIIRLTRAKSVDEYVATVEGRIKALALAHTLLSNSRWHGADLGTLVAEEFGPYRIGNKFEVKGPNVSLSPATAQGIALALHELSTNAAKHGALSSMKGTVSLTWLVQSDTLTLRWVESGGPPIKSPSARNFGLKVIRASVEQQLGGEVKFDWNSKGLRCDLVIPLLETAEAPASEQPQPAPVAAGNGAAIPLTRVDKPRVLIIEDEALVGIMIQDYLREFGFEIVGPVCSAADALDAAKAGQFDAAILDINLGDGPVYQVAEILSARRVPFVFVTGYDADSVDSRFREIPVLQKPVEREMLQKLFAQATDRSAKAETARPAHRARAG